MGMEIPEEAARRLVGPAADHYLRQWRRLDEPQSQKPGFSWVGLFFGPYWMLYRRMYRACGIWIAAAILWGIVEELAVLLLHLPRPSELFDQSVAVGIAVTCGVFGSYWYYLETRRRYQRLAEAQTLGPADLEGAGGVSRAAVWTGVLVTLVITLMIATCAPATPM